MNTQRGQQGKSFYYYSPMNTQRGQPGKSFYYSPMNTRRGQQGKRFYYSPMNTQRGQQGKSFYFSPMNTQWGQQGKSVYYSPMNTTLHGANKRSAHRASFCASSMTSVCGQGEASDQPQKDQRQGKSPRWKAPPACLMKTRSSSNNATSAFSVWNTRHINWTICSVYPRQP
jgi:hypothetical protein